MTRPSSRFAHRSPEEGADAESSMYSEDAFAASFGQQDVGYGAQETGKGGSSMLTAPPFRFQTHRMRLDWRLLHGMDVERVVRDVDIDALESVVDTIASGDIEAEDTRNFTESNFVKLFRVAQLIVEYLMHIQDTLATHKEHLKTTAYEARRRAEMLRIKCRDQKEHLGACRRELRRCKKSLQMYEILLRLRGHTPGDEVFSCHVCHKVFQSEHYLDLHYKRRHPGTAPAPQRGPGAAEDPSHPSEPGVDIAALQNAMLLAQREAMEAREAKAHSDREVAILREQLKAQDMNKQDVRAAIEQVKAAEQQAASATVESVRAAEREAARREQERTVAGLTSELAAARESLRALEARQDRLQKDSAAARRELDEAQAGEQAAKDALQRERDAVRMPSPKVIQVGAKSTDLGEDGERRLAVAEAQVEALRKEKLQLQAEMEAAQAEAAKLRHDKRALQDRLAALESSTRDADAAAEAERRRLVREKVEELERVRKENEEEKGKLVADLTATKQAAGVSHAAYDAQRRAEAAREEAVRAAKEAEDLAAGRKDPRPAPPPPPPPEPEVRTVTVAVAAKPPSPEPDDVIPAGHVPPEEDKAYGLQAEVEAEQKKGQEPGELAPAGAEPGEVVPPASDAPPPRQAFGLVAEVAADEGAPPPLPAEEGEVSPTSPADLEAEAGETEQEREAEAEAAREQARSLADEAASAANAPISLHPDEEAQWRREHPSAPMVDKPFAVARYRHDADLVREWRPDVEVILEDKLARALEEYGIDPEADGLSDRDYAAAMDRLEQRRAEMLRAASPAERERMEADRRAVAWHMQHAGEMFASGRAPAAHNPPEARPLPPAPSSLGASSVSAGDSSFDTPRWGPDPTSSGTGPSDPAPAAKSSAALPPPPPPPPSAPSAAAPPPPPGGGGFDGPRRPTADTHAVAQVMDELTDDLESEVAVSVSQDDPRLRASVATTATDYTEATTATGYTTTSASGYDRSSFEVMSSVDSGGSEMFQQMRAQQQGAGPSSGRMSRGAAEADPAGAWGGGGGVGRDGAPSRSTAVAESVESIADSLEESGGTAAWGGTPTRPSAGSRLAPMSGGPVGSSEAGPSGLGAGSRLQGAAADPSSRPSPSKGDTVIEAFDIGASSTDEERAGTPSPVRRPIAGRRAGAAAGGGGVTSSMASMPSPGGVSEVSDVEEIAL